MTFLITDIGRVLGALSPPDYPMCVVCKGPIRGGDERVRLRGGAAVHRGCATYRMRNRQGYSRA
jgi:hypothetical protein